MSPQQVYEWILQRLAADGITGISDLPNYAPDWLYADGGFLTSAKYPWVEDIHKCIEDSYEDLYSAYLGQATRPILIDQAPGEFLRPSLWKVTDPLFPLRARYAALLPRQCLFASAQFRAVGEPFATEKGHHKISEDFLPLLFSLKPLLLSNFAILLPYSMRYHDEDGDGESGGSLYTLENADSTITVHPESVSSSKFDSSRFGNDPMRHFSIQMPWLQNVRAEEVVDVAHRYPTQFELYQLALNEVITATGDPDKNFELAAKKFRAAALELDLIYDQKRRELRRKGVDVALGGFLTIGAMLVPGAQMLAPIVGGKTAWDGFRVLQDFRELKSRLGHESGWILWSLKRVSDRADR